jgi:predicted transcriptional regulator
MRKSGKWMVLLDERILELLSEEENEYMSPSDIADHDRIPYSSQHVGRRCKKLAEHGLLKPVGRGIYTISDEGSAYLREEYNAAENGNAEFSNNGEVGESPDEV